MLIILYAVVNSPEEGEYYAVKCVHEAVLGEPCPSCGMSRAFSLIVRGRVDEARLMNSHSTVLFLFFSLQLLIRAAVSALLMVKRRGRSLFRVVLLSDIAVSSVMALITFYPLVRLMILSMS